jgi:hypothetical protein
MIGETLPRLSGEPERGWPLNLVLFQIGWWAVVLTAAQGQPELGIGLVALSLAYQLAIARAPLAEAALVGAAATVGLVLDSLLLATGWVEFTGGNLAGQLAPPWMLALWVNFALTLNVSLRPLQERPLLAAGIGLIGGPLAYWGGAQLGAMTFLNAPAALTVLAIEWAVLTPLLAGLAKTLREMLKP